MKFLFLMLLKNHENYNYVNGIENCLFSLMGKLKKKKSQPECRRVLEFGKVMGVGEKRS